MNINKMKKKALNVLSCKKENLKIVKIPNQKAVYFCNTTRGGGAVIISEDESMLVVNPFFVNYEEHLSKFLLGERTLVPTKETNVEKNMSNKIYYATFILLIVYIIMFLGNCLVINSDSFIDTIFKASNRFLIPVLAVIISVMSIVNIVKKVKIISNVIFIILIILLFILFNYMPLFISEKISEQDMIDDANNLIAKIKDEEPRAYFFSDLLEIDSNLKEKGYTDNSYITYNSANNIYICLSNGETKVTNLNNEYDIDTIGELFVSDCGTSSIMTEFLTQNYIQNKYNVELTSIQTIIPLFGGGENRTGKDYQGKIEDTYIDIRVDIINDELVYEDNYLTKINQ